MIHKVQSCLSLLAVAGMMAGCALEEKSYPTPAARGGTPVTKADDGSNASLRLTEANKTTVAPAPVAAPAAAPAAKAAEPARPAPMVVAPSGGIIRNAMAFPTGDRTTSVVWLERTAPSEVVAGQEFTYDYKITNLTTNTLTSVVLRDRCAQGFTVVSSNPASGSAAPDLMWNLGDFKPNETKTVTVRGKATGVGKLESCAQVTYASMLCIETAVVQPALAINLTMQPEALVCDTITSKVCVTNNGTGVARNVKVNYPLPAGLTTANGQTSFTADVGDLPAGQNRCFDVALKAAKPGSYAANAATMADLINKVDSNGAQVVVRQPVLTIKADCPKGPIISGRGGRDVTFKFTVTNTGDAASANTMVSAALPAGATFGSADNNGQNAGGRVNWNLGTLEAKATRTVAFTIKSGAAGALATQATVNGNCSNPATENCSVTVEGVPDMGTLLTDDDGVRPVGDTHDFRYEVKNQGLIPLTNVKAVFKLGDGLTFKSSTAPSQPQVAGNTLTYSLGTIPVGGSIKFSIVSVGNKEGVLVINCQTTATETKVPNDASEQVNYVAR